MVTVTTASVPAWAGPGQGAPRAALGGPLRLHARSPPPASRRRQRQCCPSGPLGRRGLMASGGSESPAGRPGLRVSGTARDVAGGASSRAVKPHGLNPSVSRCLPARAHPRALLAPTCAARFAKPRKAQPPSWARRCEVRTVALALYLACWSQAERARALRLERTNAHRGARSRAGPSCLIARPWPIPAP